jgi:hypothetical protein
MSFLFSCFIQEEEKNMRLSWPNRVNSRRTILTDREDVEEEMAVAETPVSAATYDMPSSPGSLSTTNDAATLIASPDHRSGSFPVNNRRISRYGAQQLEAISIVDDEDDDDGDDDDYEQKRQLLTDVIITQFLFSTSKCVSAVYVLSHPSSG